jgi:hypothetical protein
MLTMSSHDVLLVWSRRAFWSNWSPVSVNWLVPPYLKEHDFTSDQHHPAGRARPLRPENVLGIPANCIETTMSWRPFWGGKRKVDVPAPVFEKLT